MGVLWLLGETQYIVSLLTAVVILSLRSPHALFFGAGTLVAAGAAKALKLALRQPRPDGAQGKTYGMPSTHSCAIAFFAVYLALTLLLLPLHARLAALALQLPRNPPQQETPIRVALAAIVLSSAGAVCWSRIKLNHHTPPQVLAGIALGSLVALAWLTLWVGVVPAARSVGLGEIRWIEGYAPAFVLGGLREEGEKVEAAIRDAMGIAEGWRREGRTD